MTKIKSPITFGTPTGSRDVSQKALIKSLINKATGGIIETPPVVNPGQEEEDSGAVVVVNNIVNITYSELKDLRDSGLLVPGQQYKITDYECTTAQENTMSAGHKFDIIVTADTESVLNENARACVKKFEIPTEAYFPTWYEAITYKGEMEYEGKKYYCYGGNFDPTMKVLVSFTKFNLYRTTDNYGEFKYAFEPEYLCAEDDGELFFVPGEGEWIAFRKDVQETAYFKDCNLSAWELKYSLDNDATKFAWAKKQESVELIKIKWLFNNTIHWRVRAKNYVGDGYRWNTVSDYKDELDDSDIIFSYEASYSGAKMAYSESAEIGNFGDEDGAEFVILDYKTFSREGKGIIYWMKDEWNNECPYDFKNIMFDGKWGYWAYTFNTKTSSDSEDASVKQFKYRNYAGSYSHTNDNVIKPYGYNSAHGNGDDDRYPYFLNFVVFLNIGTQTFYGCYDNVLGLNVHNVVFGHTCRNNRIGSESLNIRLKDGCTNIKIGQKCREIEIGDWCHYINIKEDEYELTIGNQCDYIYFVHCGRCIVGEGCHRIRAIQSYGNTFQAGCQSKYLYDTVYKTLSGNSTELWFASVKKW